MLVQSFRLPGSGDTNLFIWGTKLMGQIFGGTRGETPGESTGIYTGLPGASLPTGITGGFTPRPPIFSSKSLFNGLRGGVRV